MESQQKIGGECGNISHANERTPLPCFAGVGKPRSLRVLSFVICGILMSCGAWSSSDASDSLWQARYFVDVGK